MLNNPELRQLLKEALRTGPQSGSGPHLSLQSFESLTFHTSLLSLPVIQITLKWLILVYLHDRAYLKYNLSSLWSYKYVSTLSSYMRLKLVLSDRTSFAYCLYSLPTVMVGK